MSLGRLLSAVLVAAASAGPAPGNPPEPALPAAALDDEHVAKAIDAIVETLYARKNPTSFWDPLPWKPTLHGSKFQGGGYTAMTVLALLIAGESYQDPRLRDAIAALEGMEMPGTYAVAFRLHVWANLPPKFLPKLERNAQWLLESFSERAAGWDYSSKPTTRRSDNSIRQYGALALWEAAKRGVEIDERYWQRLEQGFLDAQQRDGGWNYKGGDYPSTGSMTTAGLATLFITQDLLHADRQVRLGGDLPKRMQSALDRGLAWMDEHFSPYDNPGSGRDFYYYLYGVERVGLAGGHKYFGGRDWFRTGAAELIDRLCTWDPTARTMAVKTRFRNATSASSIRSLAYALMFLSRGRVPVAINKLEIPELATDNRPRDVANLTRWIALQTESELSWQRVELDQPPEAWLDAPLLYLAAKDPLPGVREAVRDQRRRARDSGDAATPQVWSSPLIRLKQYLDLGGLLFAVNEGSSRGFAESVEALGALLYPEAEWHPVPEDHPAYGLHAHVNNGRPPLRALSNGVRDLIILVPGGDLAASYQSNLHDRYRPVFDTAANLYFLASEMNRPHPRLARTVSVAGGFTRTARTLTVARGRYDGNWNPEPAALPRLGRTLEAAGDVTLRVVDHPLATIAELDPAPVLLVVSGTAAHAFTSDERQALRRYVDGGGIVLFETAGGLGDFAEAAEKTASEIYGEPIRSVRREAVVTGSGLHEAADLRKVEYRPFALEVFGSRETTPRLRGMTIRGAPRLLFSREDLSHGLLDQPYWGVSGYSPADARQLMTNIILYADAVPEGG